MLSGAIKAVPDEAAAASAEPKSMSPESREKKDTAPPYGTGAEAGSFEQ
jgi:hypothetical protein